MRALKHILKGLHTPLLEVVEMQIIFEILHMIKSYFHFKWMDGIKMLKLAKRTLPKFMMYFLDETEIQFSSIDAIFPHQASKTGLELFKKMFELGDRNIKVNIENYGNCIAASIPLLLHDCIENGEVSRGDLCMLFGTSAGFSIGALVFKY